MLNEKRAARFALKMLLAFIRVSPSMEGSSPTGAIYSKKPIFNDTGFFIAPIKPASLERQKSH